MVTGRGSRALAALVLIAGAVTALVVSRPSDEAASATPPVIASEPGTAVSSPAVLPSSGATPPQPLAPDGLPSEPEIVASRAIAAWQLQDVAARTGGLTTVATPAYREAAADIEPSRVPTSPLATTSLRVEADGQALVDARLADGTTLTVLLVQVGDSWLVDDLRPADELDAAGAP